MRLHLWPAAALIASAVTVGCEGDMPLRMVQQDVDSTRTELASVARTAEGTRMVFEDRLKRLEDRLDKSERAQRTAEERLKKVDQERKEAAQGFMQSQAALTVKLDELTTELHLAQGQTEGIGHGVTEINRRVDEFGRQLDSFGRRLSGLDKQASQAAGAAQEALTASQQTAQQATAALQQMAHQTNAAIEQVNATAQLALSEARKTTKGKPVAGSTGLSRAETQHSSPAAGPVTATPIVPAASAPVRAAAPPAAAPRTAEPPSPPAPAAKPAAKTESPDELYTRALRDYTKGNYESAISGFRSIVELYPDSRRLPSAWYWLGESYYSQKDYDQASKEFESLVKQFPKSQEAKRAKERLSQIR